MVVHHIYGKDGRIEWISVPVHGNQDLKRGLQRALMRIAEIPESDL
jgi:predicted RNA binding protein YcfA (HicA-like mRNA interferase family)